MSEPLPTGNFRFLESPEVKSILHTNYKECLEKESITKDPVTLKFIDHLEQMVDISVGPLPAGTLRRSERLAHKTAIQCKERDNKFW